ncbi:MAG TPA: dihydrofolate reductase family protein [Solirubrobacteraceae bacterium]|jgi:5-amino-6-(5-phosphoribosylamino)uracil reductase|nr:dihydrofolate reductase family protein [Solirubrobacteraceae bacterium]
MEFQQLLPEPGPFDLGERLAALDLQANATDRPYTIANFVSSVDGHATFAGRSGQLGDDGDRAMFHGLREQADAVLVGTKTLAIERYGRILGRPERRERRVARGLSPEPLACVITHTGMVPTDIPLFDEPEQRIAIFTSAEIPAPECAATVELVQLDPAELTCATVLRRLHADFAVRALLCEGGPSTFGVLLHEGLVDELFLTVAAKLTGGGQGPAITTGPELPIPQELSVIWALERQNSLFLRYGIARD